MSELDIQKNRNQQKYPLRVQLKRILWGVGKILFRCSFRTMFGWRNMILRTFGAKISANVHIYNSATIYMPWNLDIDEWSSIGEHAYLYNLAPIQIGKNVTVSQRSHLCTGTHEYEKKDVPLVVKPIRIENNCWVCTDAFIGPGVTLGVGCVVAARAVVTKDIEKYSVVAGNPAKEVKKRVIEKE